MTSNEGPQVAEFTAIGTNVNLWTRMSLQKGATPFEEG